MNKYHLAIDIGASSGRHILGWLENDTIRLEEVHRFPNEMQERAGSLCWDTEKILDEIILGMKKCADIGKVPASVGIDTWGVDFVLLDKEGNLTSPAIAYRDSRTEGMDEEVYKCIPEPELYARAGIQKQMFNTIFQLMAVKLKTPEYFENAAHLLLMPDYLHYRLSGSMQSEYTIASTTGLLNAHSCGWDDEIISRCGFPGKLFRDVKMPGTWLGRLTREIQEQAGFDCEVILPPSHDTASAFLAVPAKQKRFATGGSVYISSGTWSLMGVELLDPITTKESFEANISNEGGYGRQILFLTNIMGLWMIQSVQKEIGGGLPFTQIADMAGKSDYQGIVDVGDMRFFAPASMTEAVRAVCRENGYSAPGTLADMARCIYRSLALSYAKNIKTLETLIGTRYESINITGGGSNNAFLNKLTAETCKLPVYAGPAEGTALGNIVCQMIACGKLSNVQQARRAIRNSFDIAEYSP